MMIEVPGTQVLRCQWMESFYHQQFRFVVSDLKSKYLFE